LHSAARRSAARGTKKIAAAAAAAAQGRMAAPLFVWCVHTRHARADCFWLAAAKTFGGQNVQKQ
jgi:hypothetical protein